MSNLIPIQITLQAANAADARQLVQDLAGTMHVLPTEQIPPQTNVSAVDLGGGPALVAPTSAPAYAPPVMPAQPPMAPPPGVPTSPAPAQPAVPVAGQPPMAPPAAPAATVPIAPQTYSMEQIAVAATQLVDAGRQNDVVTLLGQFGVQALTQLPKEQYGNFATALRGLGAKI